MPIEREDSLRKAEKLLRQGRLDAAIQEYARLLEEQPTDWNTRNVLGDLYVRANRLEQAAAQFTQIADHFAHEGFFPRAIALYKKVVKIKPDDEHALLQSAELSAQQGLLAEAKAAFVSIADQRRKRGDKNGSSEILIRIAALDPSDLAGRMAAARAAADMGDSAGAAGRYKEVAAELFQRSRPGEAIDALAEAVHLDPSDETTRDSLVGAHLERGEIEDARRYAATGFHYLAIADELSARGMDREALDALAEAVQRDPADTTTRVRLVRSLIAAGEVERAIACVSAGTLGDDPELLLLAAEVDLRTGHTDSGRDRLRAALARDPARRDAIVELGRQLTQLDWDAGFECADVAAEAFASERDWPGAARCLQEFVGHAQTHIAALIRLVDVCVDGDLDDILVGVQAKLAEAYLLAGRAFEARVIAEDLVTRAPGDQEHIDRFRRALVMLGEPNPEAVIADRLAPDPMGDLSDLNVELAGSNARNADRTVAPAVSHRAPASAAGPPATAPMKSPEQAATPDVPPRPDPATQPVAPPIAAATAPARPAETAVAAAGMPPVQPPPGTRHEPIDRPRHDLNAGTGDHEEPAAVGESAGGDAIEIDLNAVLGDMNAGSAAPEAAAPAAPVSGGRVPAATPGAGQNDLDEVFAGMRHEVAKEQSSNVAAQHYKLALTYHDMGMMADCLKALETAARSPRYRFQAASLIGRVHRQQGRTHEAIDWFERAAEAPAASVDAGRALLYELGQALEDEGEAVRALAVYLELQADAGDYRDVAARIKRLSR